MAEREGFEPSVEVCPYDGLANRCLRPLGHLSVSVLSSNYVGGFDPAERFVPDYVTRQYACDPVRASSHPALPLPIANAAGERWAYRSVMRKSLCPSTSFTLSERPRITRVTRRGMPEIVRATVENPGAFASGLKGGAHLSPGAGRRGP